MTPECYLASRAGNFESDLFRLLEIPSVSCDPSYAVAVERCAEEVARQLRAAGAIEVEVLPTAGHPAVVGRHRGQGQGPRVLIYGHYDVQPPEPLEAWSSPPFQPTVRDGRVYARGATDDKGQFLVHIKALEALVATRAGPPGEVVFLIEGEEECGSRNLPAFLEANLDRLRADLLVVSDTSMFAPGHPSLIYGLRGLAFVEIELAPPPGRPGDPAHALCSMLARLKDGQGRVQIPGFYERVLDLTTGEREHLSRLDDSAWLSELGLRRLTPEAGYTSVESRMARPTLEVNGLVSYDDPPARAVAKLTCRLVSDQQPAEIVAALDGHLRHLAPEGWQVQTVQVAGGHPWVLPVDHPVLACAGRAVEAVWGRAPQLIREGGTIPVVPRLGQRLGIPAVLLGFGLAGENLHAPDEHFHLENFHRGMRTSVALLDELSRWRPA